MRERFEGTLDVVFQGFFVRDDVSALGGQRNYNFRAPLLESPRLLGREREYRNVVLEVAVFVFYELFYLFLVNCLRPVSVAHDVLLVQHFYAR